MTAVVAAARPAAALRSNMGAQRCVCKNDEERSDEKGAPAVAAEAAAVAEVSRAQQGAEVPAKSSLFCRDEMHSCLLENMSSEGAAASVSAADHHSGCVPLFVVVAEPVMMTASTLATTRRDVAQRQATTNRGSSRTAAVAAADSHEEAVAVIDPGAQGSAASVEPVLSGAVIHASAAIASLSTIVKKEEAPSQAAAPAQQEAELSETSRKTAVVAAEAIHGAAAAEGENSCTVNARSADATAAAESTASATAFVVADAEAARALKAAVQTADAVVALGALDKAEVGESEACASSAELYKVLADAITADVQREDHFTDSEIVTTFSITPELVREATDIVDANKEMLPLHIRERLERDLARNWDLFYKRNCANFFKDRRWIQKEFHELSAPSQSKAGCSAAAPKKKSIKTFIATTESSTATIESSTATAESSTATVTSEAPMAATAAQAGAAETASAVQVVLPAVEAEGFAKATAAVPAEATEAQEAAAAAALLTAETTKEGISSRHVLTATDASKKTENLLSKKVVCVCAQQQSLQCNSRTSYYGSERKRPLLVDIGCGVGNALIPVLETFPHLRAVGLDCSKRAIEMLQRRWENRARTARNSTASFSSKKCAGKIFHSSSTFYDCTSSCKIGSRCNTNDNSSRSNSGLCSPTTAPAALLATITAPLQTHSTIDIKAPLQTQSIVDIKAPLQTQSTVEEEAAVEEAAIKEATAVKVKAAGAVGKSVCAAAVERNSASTTSSTITSSNSTIRNSTISSSSSSTPAASTVEGMWRRVQGCEEQAKDTVAGKAGESHERKEREAFGIEVDLAKKRDGNAGDYGDFFCRRSAGLHRPTGGMNEMCTNNRGLLDESGKILGSIDGNKCCDGTDSGFAFCDCFAGPLESSDDDNCLLDGGLGLFDKENLCVSEGSFRTINNTGSHSLSLCGSKSSLSSSTPTGKRHEKSLLSEVNVFKFPNVSNSSHSDSVISALWSNPHNGIASSPCCFADFFEASAAKELKDGIQKRRGKVGDSSFMKARERVEETQKVEDNTLAAAEGKGDGDDKQTAVEVAVYETALVSGLALDDGSSRSALVKSAAVKREDIKEAVIDIQANIGECFNDTCRHNEEDSSPDEAILEVTAVHDITKGDVPACICTEGSASFVLLLFVLSAVPPTEHAAVVLRCAKLLMPHGLLFFRDYGRFDHAQLRFAKSNKTKKFANNSYVRYDGTLAYYFTTEELRDLMCRQGGLEEVENRYCLREFTNRKTGVRLQRIWIQAKFRQCLNRSSINK